MGPTLEETLAEIAAETAPKPVTPVAPPLPTAKAAPLPKPPPAPPAGAAPPKDPATARAEDCSKNIGLGGFVSRVLLPLTNPANLAKPSVQADLQETGKAVGPDYEAKVRGA